MRLIAAALVAMLPFTVQANEVALNANCAAMIIALDRPQLMEAAPRIFYEGYVEGAAAGRTAPGVIRREYREVCLRFPKFIVRGAMEAAIKNAEN